MVAIARSVAIALAGLFAQNSFAQAYPTKPIRWIVAFPPGGGSDLYARTLAQKIGVALGQPVIVENRPGASGIIGAEQAAKSAPDGYTLFACDIGTMVLNPLLYAKLPYDPAADLQPVTLYAKNPLVFAVHPSVPANTVKEFVDYARSNPGRITYASVGPGTIFHLATEIFQLQTQTKLVHVPYKGAAPAVQDLVGGQVQMMLVDYATSGSLLKAGKLRALGVSTKERISALPALPSLDEAGVPGFDAYAWLGAAVQKRTPRPIVNALSRELVSAMNASDVRQKFTDTGVVPLASTIDEFEQLLQLERTKWGTAVKTLGLKLEL